MRHPFENCERHGICSWKFNYSFKLRHQGKPRPTDKSSQNVTHDKDNHQGKGWQG